MCPFELMATPEVLPKVMPEGRLKLSGTTA
jgi:hypothetical protein